MKPTYAALTAMAGLLALLNAPLHAQSPSSPAPPSAPESAPPAPKAPEEAPPSRRPSPPEPGRGRGAPMAEEKPTPFIGVLTGNVPRELRSHFGLAEGFGLLVEEVMPDTPAKTAGLKVDDILIRFEDQKLVNMEQLQTLVRSKKKGDAVPLTVISGGVEKQVTVTVDERLMPTRRDEPRRGDGFFPSFGGSFFGGERGSPEMMSEMRESMERYQNQMREYQERMREWSREGSQGNRPQPPAWNGPGRRDSDRRDGGSSSRDGDRGSRGRSDGDRRSEVYERRETANVTRSDDSGIYSLRREGDRTVFTAKPKDGQEQSWTISKDEERRSIPEPLQEKLRLLEEIQGNDRGPDGPRGPDSRSSAPRPGGDGPRPDGDI